MSTTTGSIYNTTDGPLTIDEAGHVLAGRTHRDGVNLTGRRVAAHLAAGRLIATPATATKTKPSTNENKD